jgi:prepilin signal peptidase PulO-like enzyme (type II secretory pathway)
LAHAAVDLERATQHKLSLIQRILLVGRLNRPYWPNQLDPIIFTTGKCGKQGVQNGRMPRLRRLILALAGLFVLYAVLSGHWAGLMDVAFAGLMFVVLVVFYGLGRMGGGDVKILAVAFLWTGLSGALAFAVLLALHGLAAKLGWVKSQVTDRGRRRIPFAPSVAR